MHLAMVVIRYSAVETLRYIIVLCIVFYCVPDVGCGPDFVHRYCITTDIYSARSIIHY